MPPEEVRAAIAALCGQTPKAPAPKGGEFVEIINDLARQWAARRAWQQPRPRVALTVVENPESPGGDGFRE
jgi:hypothetical protein